MAIKQIFFVLLVICFVNTVFCCGASAKKKIKMNKRIKNYPKMGKICCKVKKAFIKSGLGKSHQHQKAASSFQKFAFKHTIKNIPTSLPFVPNKVKHDDPCASWMGCPVHHNSRVKAWLLSLPACPCYLPPFRLFDNDTVYDQIQKRTFSWKVIGSKYEMLRVFKPGAVYCARQLFDPLSNSPATQQCCYDKSYQLITRGSGAGTPNLVAPELDSALHNKLDLEPYMFCQGDWTKYQAIRHPNNKYNCTANPGMKTFIAQVKKARNH